MLLPSVSAPHLPSVPSPVLSSPGSDSQDSLSGASDMQSSYFPGASGVRRASLVEASLPALYSPAPLLPPSFAELSVRPGYTASTRSTTPPSPWCPSEVTPLIPQSLLQRRVTELAQQITDDYRDKMDAGLVMMPVLHGAKMFDADLERAIPLLFESTGVRLKSYGNEKTSSGRVEMTLQPELSLRGKHIVVVEDIIDTGKTMDLFLRVLKNFSPASVEVATLLVKPSKHLVQVNAKYVGFEVEDLFVVGYGLDYQQRYRNLSFVGTL